MLITQLDLLKTNNNEKQLENLVTSLITYGEDSLRQEGKREVLELQEQFTTNRKFKKVLLLVFEIFESFTLKPSFMERMNFSFLFREFVIDKYIAWRAEGTRLKELMTMPPIKENDKLKQHWVDLVRLYNSLSVKIEDFHVLLHKTSSFIEKYKEIKLIFCEDHLFEVVKIASRFLFCQKLFKECNNLLTNVLGNSVQTESNSADFKMFEKLQEACTRASSDTQIVYEIEEVSRPSNMNVTQRRRAFEAEEVVLEAEAKVLTPQEINEKVSSFEKLPILEQIDKADSYLLSFLITQRKVRPLLQRIVITT